MAASIGCTKMVGYSDKIFRVGLISDFAFQLSKARIVLSSSWRLEEDSLMATWRKPWPKVATCRMVHTLSPHGLSYRYFGGLRTVDGAACNYYDAYKSPTSQGPPWGFHFRRKHEVQPKIYIDERGASRSVSNLYYSSTFP